MELLVAQDEVGSGLAGALLRVAAEPASIGSLHEILGGFCHQSRNVLNCMKLSLYLARRAAATGTAERLAALDAQYQEVERFFDRLQAICRPMALTPIRLPLGLLIDERRDTWEGWMASRGRRLELVSPGAPAVGAFDPNRLGQGLDAFIAWRAEAGAAGEPARLGWRAEGPDLVIEWDESAGCGVTPSGSIETLALPLLARVIAAHGGRLEFDPNEGVHVAMRWPLDGPARR